MSRPFPGFGAQARFLGFRVEGTFTARVYTGPTKARGRNWRVKSC